MARPPILTLSDIRLTFGGNPLFTGLNLAVQLGERICLVGRNGSGKSTLMQIIAGMVEPDGGTRFANPGLSIGYMAQDPDLSGFATLGEFARSELDPAETYRIEMAAEGLMLALDASPQEASGGERRRAALAKILAEAPDLMLLDEPTNHLDITAINWLEDYLKNSKNAFIVISHDRAFLRSLTNSTLWVDRGVARQQAKGFSEFEAWRDKTYQDEDSAQHKLNRLIKSEGRWAVEGISARRKRNQGRVRRLAELRSDRAGQIARSGAAKMAFEAGAQSGRLVSEAFNISKAYGSRCLIDNFSLRIMRGDRVALVGPNGAGKTTLLNILTGHLKPDRGKLRLGNNLVPALFDQNREELDPNQSLWEALTQDESLGVSGQNDQVMVRGKPKHVIGYLKEFLFDDSQARGPVSALSGGEKARLLLARIMARESNLLILDEPTNDLDIETLDLLQELLDDYAGTVILVSHDRDFIDRVASTTIAMPGDGTAIAYAGGWSDYQAQLSGGTEEVPKSPGVKSKQKQRDVRKGSSSLKPSLSFTDEHRLTELPKIIARLEAEISKLEIYMSDPDLYTAAPRKFDKANEALTLRKTQLTAAEEEWLVLAERLEATQG